MAPALELVVSMNVAPAQELSFSWLQRRLLFVITHYYFQLSWCALNKNELYQVYKTKRIYQTF